MDELFKVLFDLIGSFFDANADRERVPRQARMPLEASRTIVRSRKKKPLRRGLARRMRRPSKHGSRITWT